MKQFAFPLSIKCASVEERDECLNLLESIGYKTDYICGFLYVVNCYSGVMGVCCTIPDYAIYAHNCHHIDHFNPDIIRDIARVCTNDTWLKDEVVISMGHLYCPYEFFYEIIGKSYHENIKYFRRPTIAEICEHHGYEIKGRDIVKKEEKISNCDKSYCETAMRLDEATAEINRLKAENAKLHDMALSVNRELTQYKEAYLSVKNRETKVKDLIEDIASELDMDLY
jgi:hypothetical protein